MGAAHTPRAVRTARVCLCSPRQRQRLAGLQAAAGRLRRGERLIQRGNIALLDNPSDNVHPRLSPTIALGLPWAVLLTQLVQASLARGRCGL